MEIKRNSTASMLKRHVKSPSIRKRTRALGMKNDPLALSIGVDSKSILHFALGRLCAMKRQGRARNPLGAARVDSRQARMLRGAAQRDARWARHFPSAIKRTGLLRRKRRAGGALSGEGDEEAETRAWNRPKRDRPRTLRANGDQTRLRARARSHALGNVRHVVMPAVIVRDCEMRPAAPPPPPLSHPPIPPTPLPPASPLRRSPPRDIGARR